MPTIPNFPQSLLDEHHCWHGHGSSTRVHPMGQPGGGLEFLRFHRDFVSKALAWYRQTIFEVSPFNERDRKEPLVARWEAVPDDLKKAIHGWDSVAADSTRLSTGQPNFASADELGTFIETGIHAFLHNASATEFNESVLRTFDSPRSTVFYKIHGLVDYWWRAWQGRNVTGGGSVKVQAQPSEWAQRTGWVMGPTRETDVFGFAYVGGRGVGAFVYEVSLPAFTPGTALAGISAVLTSAHASEGSDVSLVVNGEHHGMQRVQPYASGASGPSYEWVIPAAALRPGELNTLEFRVGSGEKKNGLFIFSKGLSPLRDTPIQITIPHAADEPSALANDSAFVVQKVPVLMAPGSTNSVSISMRNIGTKEWRPGRHRLGSESPRDNITWGRSRVELAEAVPPGGTAVFTFDVVAPQVPGEHIFRWKMLEERVAWFGPGSPLVSVKVGPVVAPGPVPVTRDQLITGQTLGRGSELVAENALYKLIFQGDGNLVLYGMSPTRVLWATHHRASTRVVLQDDGNLVAYDANNRPGWSSGTRGSGAKLLRMQSDGNLVLYTSDFRAVWTTRTQGR